MRGRGRVASATGAPKGSGYPWLCGSWNLRSWTPPLLPGTWGLVFSPHCWQASVGVLPTELVHGHFATPEVLGCECHPPLLGEGEEMSHECYPARAASGLWHWCHSWNLTLWHHLPLLGMSGSWIWSPLIEGPMLETVPLEVGEGLSPGHCCIF